MSASAPLLHLPQEPDARAKRLALAAASPEAANQRQRERWLSLYAEDAEVSDPFGTPVCRKDTHTRPKTGKNDLELFYDTFIGGMRSLEVDVHLDVVVGDVVARDVTLRPTMALGVRSAIPTRLLYELSDGPEGLRVQRLGAYWDASQATQRTLKQGLRGQGSMVVSSLRMLRFLGRAWMQRYVAGTKHGARRPGREAAMAFGEALRDRDLGAASALCEESVCVRVLEQAPVDLPTFWSLELELEFSEPVASGDVVTVRCKGRAGERAVDGLAFFTFSRGGMIEDLRFLWE